MALSDAFVQILIVGCIAFCCPGLFNALTGLGGAGNVDPGPANAGNATLYAVFAVVGYFGGTAFNLFGNRILMLVGGLTYAFYALAMYIAGTADGADWVAILAGALLGIGAGLFWTSQGAMMLSYCTENNRGKYVAYFWMIFNLGGMVGGFLSFGLNFNNEESSQANPASYFTFVALMAIGSISSIFLLVAPSKVKKEDGTMVVFEKGTSARDEIVGALKVATHPSMLLLAVLFLSSNWYYTYQLNFVNGRLFNIRTRGFNSALYWGMQIVSALVIGLILDKRSWLRQTKAKVAFGYMFALFCVAWIIGSILHYRFEGGYDKDTESPAIDISESSRAWFPMVVLFLYAFADAAMQAYAYWIMGAVAMGDVALNARFAGFYKGIQSLGAAIAWGLDLSDNVSYAAQLWVCFGLWAVGSFLTWFAILRIEEPDDTPEIAQEEQSVSSA